MNKGSHFWYLVGAQYRDNEGNTGFFILFRGFCALLFSFVLFIFILAWETTKLLWDYCLLFCAKLKQHTAELLAHTNSWEGCSEPRSWGKHQFSTAVVGPVNLVLVPVMLLGKGCHRTGASGLLLPLFFDLHHVAWFSMVLPAIGQFMNQPFISFLHAGFAALAADI